MMSQPAVIAYL